METFYIKTVNTSKTFVMGSSIYNFLYMLYITIIKRNLTYVKFSDIL